MGNSICTSKYTMLSFLPKNMFFQFSKVANIYFVIMTVLQVIPQITITNNQPTILVPLLFVVMVSAVKDILEDMKRHAQDGIENRR